MTCVALVPFPSGPHTGTLAYKSTAALPLAHPVTWLYGPGLPKVRDKGAQVALNTPGADVALFIDSDISFLPEDAAAVVNRARATKGVAGAAFVSSLLEAQWNVFPLGVFHDIGDIEATYSVGVAGAPAVPVDGLGCGLMAIHLDVFRAILERFPALHLQETKRSGSWFRACLFESQHKGYSAEMSEDLSFCWRAGQSGCAVELVQAAAIGHRNIPREAREIRVGMRGMGLGRLIG